MSDFIDSLSLKPCLLNLNNECHGYICLHERQWLMFCLVENVEADLGCILLNIQLAASECRKSESRPMCSLVLSGEQSYPFSLNLAPFGQQRPA